MELEQELRRVLRSRDHAPAVPDPVQQVRAGMRRRRRRQRAQVLSAAALAGLVAVAGALVLQGPGARDARDTQDFAGTAVPPGFAPADVSFASAEDGWALGSVACGPARCTVLLSSRDGGLTWERRLAPPAAVAGPDGSTAGCTAGSCVSRVRAVRTRDGEEVVYAFGPDLLVTTDGGQRWVPQSTRGQDVADLEVTAAGAVRLVSPGCPCTGFELQTAAVGGDVWTTRATPPSGTAAFDDGRLERTGNRVVALLRTSFPGRAAAPVDAVVLVSSDDGRSWRTREDGCAVVGRPAERATRAVALAPDGVVIGLCQDRRSSGTGAESSFATSADSGRTYSPGRPLPTGVTGVLVAAPAGHVVVAGFDRAGHAVLLRDEGDRWLTVASRPAGASPDEQSLVFTSSRTGTWQTPLGVVLRTSDGGLSWREQPFR